MIRVYLIDDHPLILESIAIIIDDHKTTAVVGKSTGYHENLITDISTSNADVVVLDISMPQKDAFELAPMIKNAIPGIRIIIYTMHSIHRYFTHFLETNIDGYIVKSSDPSLLIDGIHTVNNGEMFYPDHILERITKSDQSMEFNQIQFTEFEKELLTLLSDHKTNMEISSIMNCELQKVLDGRKKLLLKTNTKNTNSLIRAFLS